MKKFTFVVLVLFLTSVAVFTQSNSGRLIGLVSGPDGVLPGATVILIDNQTGKEVTVTSNEEGAFSFPSLNVGTYTVTVTASGFKGYTAENLKIDIAREYSINVQLEVGGVAETVTVVAGADVVNSSGADLSTTVSPRQVLELPLNGRNPLSLIGLQAGAGQNRGNGSEIINGGRTSSTNFTRDGITVQDAFIRNGFVVDTPTVDNTGEFTVITGNSGAELGYGSSQIQLSTPRGGKDFHGALFIYNRNSKFAANRFFSNAAGRFTATDTAVIQGRATEGELRQPRPFLNRNQFGGKISGPLPIPHFGEGGPAFYKDKGFFFFSTEKYILRQQTSKTTTILTPSARAGIFSYRPTSAPAAGQCITFTNGICTVNVLTGQGLIGNTIPASAQGVLGIDPIINSRFLSRIPESGNRPDVGDNLNTTGFSFNQSDPEDRKEYTFRTDVDINDRNSINGVYRYNNTKDARTDIDTTFNPTALAGTTAPTNFVSLGWVSTITNNFTNEVRGGFQDTTVAFINSNLPAESFFLSIPLVTNPELTFRDQGRDVLAKTLADNASFVTGNHTIRFGADTQRYKVRSFDQANIGIPRYSITGTTNANTPRLPGTGATSIFPGGISTSDATNADALRYFLGGIVGSGNVGANVTSADATQYTPGASLDRNLTYNTYAAYISDQWRFRANLTLNFGLRYELYTPLHSTDGLYLEPVLGDDPVADVLNPNGSYRFIGGNAGKEGDFTKADKNNFAPVFSIAWSPTGKGLFKLLTGEGRTVIRAGYRMGYVNDEYIRSQDNAQGQNAGLTATANALNGNSTFLNDRLNRLTAPVAPAYIAPPRTYAQNNTAAFAGRFGTVFAINPELEIQRTHEYNVGIQREIGFNSVIEIRYVGTRSDNMVRTIDYNQIDIRSNGFVADFNRALNNSRACGGNINGNATCIGNGTFQALSVIPNLTAAGQTTVTNQVGQGTPADLALTLIQQGNTGSVRFLPNPNTGVGNLITNGGLFRYNALQAEIRRRFTQGLALQANYTFQKILTNVLDDGINQARVSPFLDNQDPKLDYARAPYDTTHTFNFNMIYELPFGKGKTFFNNGGITNLIFGGWQIGNIIQVTSGAPLLISDARGTLNRAGRSNNQTAFSTLTKDEIKALLGYRNVDGNLYFIDPAVIATTGRAANGFGSAAFPGQVFFNVNPGETGNIERYIFNGPRYWNWDANLIKNIRLTETSRIQLRAEAFNVTNSTRFLAPTFNVNSVNFGKITGAYGPRIMQFAARFEF